MFSADDYRLAARVLREETAIPDPDILAALEERAAQRERHDEYCLLLGRIGLSDPAELRGSKIMNQLVKDGWKPPKELF